MIAPSLKFYAQQGDSLRLAYWRHYYIKHEAEGCNSVIKHHCLPLLQVAPKNPSVHWHWSSIQVPPLAQGGLQVPKAIWKIENKWI